jgi:NAD(P)-dependent dehydrogenase (short-subunit alcohol dehydrogenase family)
MTNPVCVIVGAGGGLGKSLAATFAGAGHDVALVSRSKGGCSIAMQAAITASATSNVRTFQADAAQPSSLERSLTSIATEMGAIDVLIYNVRGEPKWKPPLEMTYDELRDVLELEAVGAYAAAKAVMPAMISRRRGTVMFSSATAAFRGSSTTPLYAIGKFALRGLAQSLGKAYAKDGVHVVHMRLDCTLDSPMVRRIMSDAFDPHDVADPDDVAKSYLWVHQQPKSAWSNEVELRPHTETWIP